MKPLMRNTLKDGKIRWKMRWIRRDRFAELSPYEKYRRHILSVRNEVYRQKFLGITKLDSSYDVSKWNFNNEPDIPGRLGWKNEHWKIYKDSDMEAMRRITNRPIGRYTPWGNLRPIYPDFDAAAEWELDHRRVRSELLVESGSAVYIGWTYLLMTSLLGIISGKTRYITWVRYRRRNVLMTLSGSILHSRKLLLSDMAT